MNAEVEHLSHSFRTDAAHLLIKARCANNSIGAPTSRNSYIAKLVVDAYMSCECAMKSMMASSSRDKSGSEVYTAIINCGHDLWRLIKQANPKSLNMDDRKMLKKATKIGVNLRYSLNIFSVTTCEFLPNDDVALKINQAYLVKFLAIAESLKDEANARHTKVFDTGKFFLLKKEVGKFVGKLREVTKKKNQKCC